MILQLYENGTLFRKDNTFCFKNKDDKVTYYPVRTIKTIYVFADVDFNASAINLIHKLSINVIFLNTSHKKIYGLYNGYASQGIYLINQVNAYQNEKRTIIAKSIVSTTSHNMIRVLKYHLKTIPELKESIEQILHYKRFLSSLHNVDKIMQTEAMIWKNYYSCFELILGIPFTRYQRGASDLVNCLINFLNLIFGSYKKKKPPKLSCLSRNRRLFFRIFFSTFNGFYCMRLYFLHLANLRTDDPSL